MTTTIIGATEIVWISQCSECRYLTAADEGQPPPTECSKCGTGLTWIERRRLVPVKGERVYR